LLGQLKGSKVLIKKFLINDYQKEELFKIFTKEAGSILSLSHPNIVNYMGCCKDREEDLCLVSEYCSDGNLYNLLHDKSKELTLSTRINILSDIAAALNFLHSQKRPIIYKDLKSCNVLLEKKGDKLVAKLSEFDISGFISSIHCSNNILWSAAEVLKSQSIGVEVDVYSFGILIWELFTREIPFEETNDQLYLMGNIIKGARPDLGKLDGQTPEDIIVLMKNCWKTNRDERPKFSDITRIINSISI
jgi:serine/threonine protein kinase